MTDNFDFYIKLIRLIANLTLFFGSSILLVKKKNNVILFTLISFLLMEFLQIFMYGKINVFFLYFLSALIYYNLFNKLYSPFFKSKIKSYINYISFGLILLSMLLNIFFFQKNDYNIIYHYIFTNVVLLTYPSLYLINLINQKNEYNSLYFKMSYIFFGFFILEIILSTMLSLLFKTELIWEISIRPFRAIIIQLFYISLIYFGWKIGKTQKV